MRATTSAGNGSFRGGGRSNPDYEFAGMYEDDGISGTVAETRPGLQQLIADCRAGLIQRVICKSISRMARNVTDLLEIIHTFNDLGVTVFFEKERQDTATMGSEFLLAFRFFPFPSTVCPTCRNGCWQKARRLKTLRTILRRVKKKGRHGSTSHGRRESPCRPHSLENTDGYGNLERIPQFCVGKNMVLFPSVFFLLLNHTGTTTVPVCLINLPSVSKTADQTKL